MTKEKQADDVPPHDASQQQPDSDKHNMTEEKKPKRVYKKPTLIKHQQINYVTAYGVK